jgi:hypothetical protein
MSALQTNRIKIRFFIPPLPNVGSRGGSDDDDSEAMFMAGQKPFF